MPDIPEAAPPFTPFGSGFRMLAASLMAHFEEERGLLEGP